jgi:YbbR domain-containing protein
MDVRKILLDNRSIKILSLGLSLALWFYVTSVGKTEVTLSVPVELRNIPPGMTVVGDVTGNLEVRIQGQERVIRDGTIIKKVVAVLDLSMSREGENMVRISPDDLKRPGGTIITHLSQTEVKVKLERIIRKTLRIEPVLRGMPAAGYRLISTTVTPQKIMIEGPASIMNMLHRLETMPIDIRRATESVTVEPKLDYQGKPVKAMGKNIIVRVHIKRAGNK